jgi:hypothetical protein
MLGVVPSRKLHAERRSLGASRSQRRSAMGAQGLLVPLWLVDTFRDSGQCDDRGGTEQYDAL